MAKTLTEKRTLRAKQVGEALAIFREKNRLSYDQLEAMLHHGGHSVSVRTLKRLILGTHTPHATTLADVEAFLRNTGAPWRIKGDRKVQVKVIRVKPRRGAWASGSR